MLQFLVTLQTLVMDRIERDDKGATLVEYGLIVGMIVAVAVLALGALGTTITTMMADINKAVADAF